MWSVCAQGRPSFPTRRSSDLGLCCRRVDGTVEGNNATECGCGIGLERALICGQRAVGNRHAAWVGMLDNDAGAFLDRKSTRLNSSHVKISYAVFCLKK